MQKLLIAVLGLFLCVPTGFADEAEDPLNVPFKLTAANETKEVTLANLGVKMKEEKVAYVWNFFSALTFFDGFVAQSNPDDFTWKTALAENRTRELFGIEKPRNARFVLDGETLTLDEEQEGFSFDIDALLTEVTEDYPNLKSYTLDLSEADVIRADELISHFGQVNTLLGTGLTVNVDGSAHQFPAQLKDILIKQESDKVTLSLNQTFVDYVISTLETLTNVEGANLVLKSADPNAVAHTTAEGRVVKGKKITTDLTESTLQTDIENGQTESTAVVDKSAGKIINESGYDLGPLELIATGLSNFETSPSGRDFNVRKALNEKINNILIPPGATFEFNDFLGPVTNSAGWQNSLAIFGGTNLRSVPGGGICQVATTVYRAALKAGLEIQKRKNHSLYVHYYVAHGDGLDATVYPGSQDLVFVNNTGSYILIEAYDSGYDAIVNFYGENDGRSITLSGPLTASNQTEEARSAVGALSKRQITWKQIISWPDGRSKTNWILSSYQSSVKQY